MEFRDATSMTGGTTGEWCVYESTVDGVCLVGRHGSKAEAVAAADRKQEAANVSTWGPASMARYSVRLGLRPVEYRTSPAYGRWL